MPQYTDPSLDTSTDFEEAHPPVPDPDDLFDVLFSDDDVEVDVDEPIAAQVAKSLPGSDSSVPSGGFELVSFAAAFAPRTIGAVPGPAPDPNEFPGKKAFRLGQAHPAVTRLGEMLIDRGGKRFYSVGAGPKFGAADRSACAAFQRAQGWTGTSADGYPGPLTWELLVTKTGKNIPAASAASTALRSPVPGYRVNYPFGIRDSRYAAGFHTGNDYAAPHGTPIVAVAAGKVIRADNGGAYGKWTQIRDADGHVWMYAHQSRRAVKPGQHVKAGQVIGYVGSTGNVTGPHLHLEKSKKGGWAYGRVVEPRW